MTVKVYDIDGTEKDEAWLAETWDGCRVLKAHIPTGATEYWKLVAVYCTTGPATLKAEVRRDGHQADNQPVVATWPFLENPSQELDTLPANQNNWAQRGVIQRTEASGLTGFGLGGGKVYDEKGKEVETYGPWYHMWVLSSAPSDCLSKTGMMGGTNHDGPLHGVWVLTPVEVVYGTLLEALQQTAQREQVIQFNKDAALQKAIFAAGFVPNSPEYSLEFGGASYIAQRAEHLATGEVRVYNCPVGRYDQVSFVPGIRA
jgi:hypothetical protein